MNKISAIAIILLSVFCPSQASAQLFVAQYDVDNDQGSIGVYGDNGSLQRTITYSGWTEPIDLAVSGSTLFATDNESNVGEFTTSGQVVNASFVPTNSSPFNLALSQNSLYVSDFYNGSVYQFNLATGVGTKIISGLVDPSAVLVNGSSLLVATWGSDGGTIGEYDLNGNVLNASLVTGLSDPAGLAVTGSDLFVTNIDSGTVGEYSLSGDPINTALLSGLGSPWGIAASSTDVYIADNNAGTVWDYNLASSTVNKNFISGVGPTTGLVFQETPEPKSFLLLAIGLAIFLVINLNKIIFRPVPREL